MNEKIQIYKKALATISTTISRADMKTISNFLIFSIEFSQLIYDYIHTDLEPTHLENNENEVEIRELCVYVGKVFYPTFTKVKDFYFRINVNNKSNEDMKALFDRVEDELYCIMALRSIRYFAYYIDRDKIPRERVWENGTMRIFENVFYYATQMVLNDNVDIIRASYFPGAGKSYAGNLIVAFWLGYCPTMSFLRITYNDELTKGFVRQTNMIIKSKRFKKVFPQFNLEDKDLFLIDNATSFQLKFSSGLSLVGTTCDGKGTGFRAKVLMLDDVVKGVNDAYNVDMQNKIVNKYDNEWTSRADNGNQKVIALGTMWSCYDLLNVIQKRALKEGVFQHPKFKYTMCDTDNIKEIRKVFISTPLLDYQTDESTVPERYSTAYGRKKREDAEDKDMFEAVYQQNPQEPAELLFAYSRLKVYKTIPYDTKKCEYQTMAFIDPVREGQNYFAMPIFRRFKMDSGEWTQFYLIDFLYKFQTNEYCQPYVVDKIVRHNIIWCGYEKNVDASYVKLLKQDITKVGYTDIKFKSIYTVKNKDLKISMARNGILYSIIYPARGLYSSKSEMGLAMIHLTTWQFEGRNKFDDSPDAIAMFTIENPTVKKIKTSGKMQIIKKEL